MGHAGGHLAQRSQLLRLDEGVLHPAQLAGPLLDPLFQRPAPLGQVVLGRPQVPGHAVERGGQLAEFVLRLDGHAVAQIAAGDPLGGLDHDPHRPGDRRGQG